MKIFLIYLAITFFYAAAFSLESAQNVWVSSSQWVDTKTMADFVNSAARIEGAATDQDRALAAFYWALRCYGHGGDPMEGPKGSEVTIGDTWNSIHVYPMHWCSPWNCLLVELWMAYKGEWTNATARKVNTCNNNHTEAALGWTDADGTFRFHMFDGHLGWFTWKGTHVASVEDMVADFSLVKNNPGSVKPYFIRRPTSDFNSVCGMNDWRYVTGTDQCLSNNVYSFVDYNPDIPLSNYKTDFYLRKGETLKRQWFNDGKPVYQQALASGGAGNHIDQTNYFYTDNSQPKDPRNHKAQSVYFVNNQRAYGNGTLVYIPALAGNKYQEGAKTYSGLASEAAVPASAPVLHAATLNTEGSVTYEVYSIYPFSESFIQGSYYVKSVGSVAIEFSIDSGATWTNVLNASTVSASAQNLNIDIGKARWDAGQKTTFNMSAHPTGGYGSGNWWPDKFYGYRYLVRIRIRATSNILDVGLASLTLRNTLMLNMHMLPGLLPGQNAITVTGNTLPANCALKVTYVWEENGVQKTSVEAAGSLPHIYNITVNETDTLKVKCKYIEMAAIDTVMGPTGVKPGARNSNTPFGSVFPNPFSNTINVAFANVGSGIRNSRIDIFNVDGKMVYSSYVVGRGEKSFAPTTTWDARDFTGHRVPPGIYFLHYRQSGESARILRIIRI